MRARDGIEADGRRPTPRLHFANQLRGIAALFVVVSHLIGVFWLMQPFLVLTTLAPAQGGALPPVVAVVNLEWFQAGPFGVGLFFLISGLVVPISLERHTAWTFIAARALRIYPTYWAGLGLQLFALLVASHVWGHPVPYDWKTILANALLVHDVAGRPSIDLVNWTLTIELRFYVLVALLAPWFRAGNLLAVLGASAAATLAAVLISAGAFGVVSTDGSGVLYLISSHLPFLVLMLMGVLFNYHVRGMIRARVLAGLVLLLGAMMALAWWYSVLHGQFTHVLNNYGYALLVFSALYTVRRHIGTNRVLDRLAAISYPVYLVHATLGFIVMKLLMVLWGVSYLPALAGAVVTAILAATALHVAVEKPSIRLGHELAAVRAGRPAGLRAR